MAVSASEGGKVMPDYCKVKVLSAINQAIPNGHVYWSRRNMILFGLEERIDGAKERRGGRDPLQPVLPLAN